MKINKLIEELKRFNQDKKVFLDDGQSDHLQGVLRVEENNNRIILEADGDYVERE